jgi:hypothetical protein
MLPQDPAGHAQPFIIPWVSSLDPGVSERSRAGSRQARHPGHGRPHGMARSSGSDDELAALGAALGIAGHAAELHDTDDELAAVLDAAPRHQERYRRRGALLAAHMRAVKHARGRRVLHLAPHVLERIDAHNERHAVRAEDVIDVTEKRRPLIKGKGAWKQWVPAAIQRVSWGTKPIKRVLKKPSRRLRRKQPRAAMVATSAASARTWVYFTQSGHSYVQDSPPAWATRVYGRSR